MKADLMTDELNPIPLDEVFSRLVTPTEMASLVRRAAGEDMGEAGDVTSRALIPADLKSEAVFVARRPGVLCGVKLLGEIARAYDPAINVQAVRSDGDGLVKGDRIASVRGSLRSILAAERVMLNFLTHLSGIATLTAGFVQAVGGTKAKIYDTRKTIPGLRALAKYAVRCGGGYCHRIGLYDAMLVKDNHVAHIPKDRLAADLRAAIAGARRTTPHLKFIEVEVDNLEQLRVILPLDVDIVLLDNMTPELLRQAVKLRDGQKPGLLLEASGGVNLQTVRAIAETGVDRISVGAITHSAPALDIGLDIQT